MIKQHNRAWFLAVPFLLLGVFCACNCRGSEVVSSGPEPAVEQRDFLSQTDEDYEFLEKIQSNAYDIAGSYPQFGSDWQKVVTEETLVRRIADIGESTEIEKQASRDELRKLIRELPKKHLSTRLENPFVYFLATEVDQHVVAAVKKLGYEDPQVIIGTLPTYSANARSVSAPSGRRVIVLNTGLFNAVNRFCKALLPVVQIRTEGDQVALSISPQWISKMSDPQSDVFIHFVDVSLEYLHVSGGENYALSEGHMLLQQRLVLAMEIFILGHEYAHAILDHKTIGGNAKELSLALAGQGELMAADALRSWIQELEADRLGAKLMLTSLELDHDAIPEVMAAGPDLALQLLDYLDRSRALHDTGRDVAIRSSLATSPEARLYSVAAGCVDRQAADCVAPADLPADVRFSDHPPSLLRRERVREYLRQNVSNQRTYLDIGAGFADVIELMWLNTMKVYAELRRQGLIPNPSPAR